MQSLLRAGACFLALSVMGACRTPEASANLPRIATNDNRATAGTMRGDTLHVALTLERGRWYSASDSGTSEPMLAFAESGRAPSIPGPMLRARSGSTIRVSIENPFPDSSLTIYGLYTRPGSPDDSLRLNPGETRTVTFAAGAPGTYFYWGTRGGGPTRPPESSQLSGAFIVDPPDGPLSPDERVFVIGMWAIPRDSSGPKPWVPRDEMVINGKSWPYTERFDLETGKPVHWRWVNATEDAHPMHLHGFYFTVHSRGDWSADTAFAPDDGRVVVTELMRPGGTMAMSFTPATAGNWLFHCHFAFHVSHFLSLDKIPDPDDPGAPDAVDHSVHGMRGLILGLKVRDPKNPGATADGSSPAPDTTNESVRRRMRLTAIAVPERFGKQEGFTYVIGKSRVSASESMHGPTLMLRRNEPVSITVVNALRAPTAVHWHGIEMEDSYSDGVPGWSGMEPRLAPVIAPRDSFDARFTPPRAGTFIYHSHSNEGYQISGGLYGALLVVDPDVPFDTLTERVIVIGADPPPDQQSPPGGRVNGSLTPAPLALYQDVRHRLRLVSINPDFRVLVRLMNGDRVLEWRPVAKDGADLPATQAISQAASVVMGPGETIDVVYAPPRTSTDSLRLLVEAELGGWSVTMPVRVLQHNGKREVGNGKR